MLERYRKKGFDEQYPIILKECQSLLVQDFFKIAQQESNQNDTKQLIIPYIKNFVEKNSYQIKDHTTEELCEKLYNDLQRFSILTQPLEDDFVEGIHINGWNNVRLQLVNGESQQIDGFNSPQHALDVVQHILQLSNQQIDKAIPAAESSINNNIRVTVVGEPICDPDVGVCAYLRKLSRKVFTKEQYLETDFAAPAELRFLEIALRRGVSILLAGKVNSGKTTFLNYLLTCMPNEFQIITIETGAREINAVKTENGVPVNNVMHLLTRPSSEENQNITQEYLVEKMLRMNPDVASVAEMRNSEAYAAIEASNSGHVIISTTHAGSPQLAHKRIANLSRKKYTTDFRMALEDAVDAYPLVVFMHTLEGNARRIMAITESYVDNGNIVYRPLWAYHIQDNVSTKTGVKIIGTHKKLNNPSDRLIEHMRLYGITQKEIEEIMEVPIAE